MLIGMAVFFFNTPAYASAATTADPGLGLEALLPQLGVFTVVLVVIKFMLGRQDVRDERSDERDSEIVHQLRHDIELLRAELIEERRLHGETRQKLIDTVLK